ncbi:hypothetical protein [Tautonia sociabilis]|uniref:hypothetical protein n=1 Tax=Tautonia sociabilis TaxID=2080755 RepID=UPI0013154EC8|nr:hypothetical protein [Tautonia sociabilis]
MTGRSRQLVLRGARTLPLAATRAAAFLLFIAAVHLIALGVLGAEPRLIGYATVPLCLISLIFRRTSSRALRFTAALYWVLFKTSYFACSAAVFLIGVAFYAGGGWIEDLVLLAFGLVVAIIGLGFIFLPKLLARRPEPQRLPRRITPVIPDHHAAERQAAAELGRLYRKERRR